MVSKCGNRVPLAPPHTPFRKMPAPVVRANKLGDRSRFAGGDANLLGHGGPPACSTAVSQRWSNLSPVAGGQSCELQCRRVVNHHHPGKGLLPERKTSNRLNSARAMPP